jgi:hypothetical protein
MAVAEVSPAHQHSVRSLCECIDDEIGVNHTGAHGSNDPCIGRILDPCNTGKIGSGIGTPVAAKRENQRLELVVHLSPSLFLNFKRMRLFLPMSASNAAAQSIRYTAVVAPLISSFVKRK